jgi:hypothetical protein
LNDLKIDLNATWHSMDCYERPHLLLGQLTNLTSLSVKIRRGDMPDMVGKLVLLEKLTWHGSHLPIFLTKLSRLRALHVTCGIGSFPALGELSNLQALSIRLMSPEGFHSIAELQVAHKRTHKHTHTHTHTAYSTQHIVHCAILQV